jgi:hypothetical protein
MEFEDESKPAIHKTKMFDKRSNMQIRDEDADSEETVSVKSTKVKMNFSQYANPSKLKSYEEDESDEDDDDLTTEGGFDESDEDDSDEDDDNTTVVESGKFQNQFTQKMSRDPQEGIKKRKILIELMSMKRTHGIELSHGISDKSSLAELALERDMHKKYLEIEETKSLYRGWIIHFANGAELLTGVVPKNKYLNPKLKGWSSQVHQNIDEFDSVLRDLAEKYGSGSSPPELRLIYLLFTSAAMYHVAEKGKEMLGNNTMSNLNKAMAGMDSGENNGGMQGPDLSNMMANFNPMEMFKAFRPSPQPNQPSVSQQEQPKQQQMNSEQIRQNAIPNYGHLAPTKPTGPLINPGQPMHLRGLEVTRPTNTSPDLVAKQVTPHSPGRFSVDTSDSEPEIKYRPSNSKIKKKTGNIKRGFKLN